VEAARISGQSTHEGGNPELSAVQNDKTVLKAAIPVCCLK
jgi:hypothetical protein